MKVIVPSNIDYDKIKSMLQVEEKKMSVAMESIYIFLSFLYPSKKYISQYEKSGYFKKINSRVMNRFSEDKFKSIKSVLLDDSATEHGPVICTDDKSIPKVKSCAYKLSDWLFTDPGYLEVEISKKLQRRLKRWEDRLQEEREDFEKSFENVRKGFDRSNLSIDDGIFKFLNNLQDRLNGRCPVEHLQSAKKYMDSMRAAVKRIKEGDYGFSINQNDHRVHSHITYIKRELRFFLRFGEEQLVELDIKSSQPYVLATMLNYHFFSEETDGYNLYTIDPRLHALFKNYCSNSEDRVNEIKSLLESFMSSPNTRDAVLLQYAMNNIYSKYNYYNLEDIDITKYSNLTNDILKKIGVPYMSQKFWQSEDILSYKAFDFDKDIYQYLADEIGLERNMVKKQFMLFLNHKDRKSRYHIPLIKFFQENYPELSKVVETLLNAPYLQSPFSILLQRSESYLFLKHGCNAIWDFPFVTIHDSVLCRQEHVPGIKYLIQSEMTRIGNIRPSLRVKPIQDPNNSIDQIADEIVSGIVSGKIKNSNSKRNAE